MLRDRARRRQIGLLLISLFLVLLLPSARAGADGVELVVVVHPNNSTQSLSTAELAAIFTTQRRHWSGSKSIIALNLPPRSEHRALFDRAVLGMDPDAVARFWIDRKVRGGAAPPRQVPDATMAVRVVAKLEAAIGYAPREGADKSVRVVARIRGGKVVAP
jgi:ABC-type phosphate transport system substrate-binding protein